MAIKRFLNEKSGFSLLEVIISLLLFSVVALVFLGLFSGSFTRVGNTGRNNRELFRAQQTIEAGISTPGSGTGTVRFTVPSSASVTVNVTVNGRIVTTPISGTNSSLTTFVPN